MPHARPRLFPTTRRAPGDPWKRMLCWLATVAPGRTRRACPASNLNKRNIENVSDLASSAEHTESCNGRFIVANCKNHNPPCILLTDMSSTDHVPLTKLWEVVRSKRRLFSDEE